MLFNESYALMESYINRKPLIEDIINIASDSVNCISELKNPSIINHHSISRKSEKYIVEKIEQSLDGKNLIIDTAIRVQNLLESYIHSNGALYLGVSEMNILPYSNMKHNHEYTEISVYIDPIVISIPLVFLDKDNLSYSDYEDIDFELKSIQKEIETCSNKSMINLYINGKFIWMNLKFV